jgi:hypothetical protein
MGFVPIVRMKTTAMESNIFSDGAGERQGS